MNEFSNECEIVGIDRLRLSCETINLLAWEMSNHKLGLREVDWSWHCKIARILIN